MSYQVGTEVAIYSPTLDSVGDGTGTLYDLKNSNDGSITNGAWTDDTANGGLRALQYSSGYTSIANSSDFAFGTSPFWFSVWFKLTSTSQQMILDKGYNTGNTTRFFFILLNSTQYRFWAGDASGALTFTASSYLNNWVNAICQRNGTSMAVWINGTLAASGTGQPAGTNLTNTDVLSFGSRSDHTTVFMAGRQGTTRIGTGVLSAQQIAKLSSRRVPATPLAQMLHHHSVAGY